MLKKADLYTDYNQLTPTMKTTPMDELICLLEKFQEKQISGLLTEEEEYQMKWLKCCIDLRQQFELQREKFIVAETNVSEFALNKIYCLENRGSIFIEAFIPDEKIWACVQSTFFITKRSLN